jgi:hypothetical protein
MADPKFISKNDLDQEPDYSGSDSDVDSGTKSCPLKQEVKEKRLVEVFFKNANGARLTEITDEEEVELHIESENMSGEEVLIDLPEQFANFALMGEEWEEDQVLLVPISGDSESVTLEVNPTRLDIEDGDPIPATLPEVATIVSIDFLNGSEDELLTAEAIQIINLPRRNKWVDNDVITNIDRLSEKPWILVKFDRPGRHRFTAQLVPGEDNAIFTAREKRRNPKFKYEERQKRYRTRRDGSAVIKNLFLDTAGNNTYKVKASDSEGNEVMSAVGVRTKKLFHFVELKMEELTAIAENLDVANTEYSRNHITIKSLPGSDMPHMENISASLADERRFMRNSRAAYRSTDARAKRPYVIALAYTDQLAVKNANKVLELPNVEVGTGKSDVEIDVFGPDLDAPTILNSRALWNQIVSTESWFVSCEFLKDGGRRRDIVQIPSAKCTAVHNAAFAAEYCDKVSIKVDHLEAETGSLKLKVHWIDMMAGGLSFGGNITCVCTRAWWNDQSANYQNQVFIHEMGHQLGMASKGTGRLPAKIPTYYTNNQGHWGPHCHHGVPAGQARYDSAADGAAHDCVMYGATASTQYCEHCAVAVRKVDMTRGWRQF